jgi:hypothetical protein
VLDSKCKVDVFFLALNYLKAYPESTKIICVRIQIDSPCSSVGGVRLNTVQHLTECSAAQQVVKTVEFKYPTVSSTGVRRDLEVVLKKDRSQGDESRSKRFYALTECVGSLIT